MKQAIQECELRWFHETAALAKEGEANQMALLGVIPCYSTALAAAAAAVDAATAAGTQALRTDGSCIVRNRGHVAADRHHLHATRAFQVLDSVLQAVINSNL